MKYYKRLNKKRKIYFWWLLIGGLIEVVLGILSQNIAMCCFGLALMVYCLSLMTEQIQDDRIDNYKKEVEILYRTLKLNLIFVKNLIKEKDEETLNKYADIVDSIYKEEKDDSNQC